MNELKVSFRKLGWFYYGDGCRETNEIFKYENTGELLEKEGN